ncbi:anti-anti-sigma factor [Streptomyces sp. PvR006]|uniref:STAS domain-containing protein n=1 Tax=unclassified Streptomyces TaxID=2593676 RepID=UPI001AE6DE49|nr:STAS domain-containing protein [Streptomyces sp. PvR006]MBP2579637.1 anti-anti-sigma factor [Streptomyces sp. PvR006]
MSDLILTTHEASDGTTITVAGELDLTSCPTLQDATSQAPLADGAPLRLDMSQVTFMDSSGLNLLLILRRRLADSGSRLLLTGVQGVPMRVLTLTGVDTLFLPADTQARR